MRKSVYLSLALNSMKKNRQLYLPYLLTGAGTVSICYILGFLSTSELVRSMRGGEVLSAILSMGVFATFLFSFLFLFYTNAFLVRRGKKELGLYNILGMSKRNIAGVLGWSSLLTALSSLILGLTTGILLSKGAELVLLRLVHAPVNLSMYVSVKALGQTAIFYGVIFTAIYINTLLQVSRTNAADLFGSDKTAEKPPRANWLLGLLGAGLLTGAYIIAVTADNPLSALMWFFGAVLMVIAGTYLLFIAGSVVFCQMLRRKKSFYYHPKHFVSVSSMVYRMKRNGAGLASICILSTMVLVMVSASASLYLGAEDSLVRLYPKEATINGVFANTEAASRDKLVSLQSQLERMLAKENAGVLNDSMMVYSYVVGQLDENGTLEAVVDNASVGGNVIQTHFFSLEEYNRLSNTQETLTDEQVLIYSPKRKYTADEFAVNGWKTFQVKAQPNTFFEEEYIHDEYIVPTMYVVLPELRDLDELMGQLRYPDTGEPMMLLHWNYSFDTRLTPEEQAELPVKLRPMLLEQKESLGVKSVYCSGRENARGDFYGTYGGLLFLGGSLSIVFLLCAALIIYYKQISEGLEDRERFQIMQQVGMTKQEIRQSIRSQMKTVFLLPLLFAGLHLSFAFPILRKMLLLFSLTNTLLFVIICVGSFLVYCLIYGWIYRLTSETYYTIVSPTDF